MMNSFKMHITRMISVFLIVVLVYTLKDVNNHYLSLTNDSVEKLMHDTNCKSVKHTIYTQQDMSICNPVTLEDFGKFKRNRSALFLCNM